MVIASRPYHNDPLVNHGLPKLFSERGIPVLTPDAVPGVCNVDLSNSRIDIVNNYHARMLSCAVIVASTPELELVQMGSFGCVSHRRDRAHDGRDGLQGSDDDQAR